MNTLSVLEKTADPAPSAINDLQTEKRELVVLSACGTCHQFCAGDEMAQYNGQNICDKCADKTIQPARYMTELFTITEAANEFCQHQTGMTLSDAVEAGLLVVIGDEFGDLVYSSLNTTSLFIDAPIPGNSTVYHLPQEMRLVHRRTQRESLRAFQHRCYVVTVGCHHWTAKISPFEVAGDCFTLTLFHDISS